MTVLYKIFVFRNLRMTEKEFVPVQDKKFRVNLEVLASTSYTQPPFRPLSSFSISNILMHGDTVSLFHGHFEGAEVLIETCNRIPFRLACREIKYLNTELAQVENIVKIKGCTRNSSLGIVSLAYDNFDLIPWTTKIPTNNLIPLFAQLLGIISKLHHRHISHNCICRSSVYINKEQNAVLLGFFHAAVKTGDVAPLVFMHPCAPKTPAADSRKDDLYSAALWFLSYFEEDPHKALEKVESYGLPEPIVTVLKKLTAEVEGDRISADKASKAILAFLNPAK